ncbi:hypothetical protein PpBr36_04457 [Pyricularia pennisetigena]|uniref:hypothetical protein n=1 Tax=Pyricularia pennisetigena TaxID=1578925 RepID=UPI001152B747|nr:hypothetical protein PpBr36_04457 [Pyricularia pennisetigena]TLS27694.1 hypothetical protein PpBr36_04457 [Pyricularia pennisetigena]
MELLDRFGKWAQLKIYQIEVTFSVYMFTPTERFIFWSIVFLVNALTLIATILYMPQHIVFIVNRAWFYINGDSIDVVGVAKDAAQTLAVKAAANSQTISSEAISEITNAATTAASVVREL